MSRYRTPPQRTIPLLMAVFTLLFYAQAVQADSEISIAGKTDMSANGAVHLSIDAFEALAPQTIIKTSTPWHVETTFSGVSGADFVRIAGVHGDKLIVRAINDYQTTIPVTDLTEHGALFVTRMNGKRIGLREKGPVFVIYPFDQHPELKTEVYIGRSIWQIKKITAQ